MGPLNVDLPRHCADSITELLEYKVHFSIFWVCVCHRHYGKTDGGILMKFSGYRHKKELARLFHAWSDCFALLRLGAAEVFALGVLLVFFLFSMSRNTNHKPDYWIFNMVTFISKFDRPISQIPQCIRQMSHNAPFCNRIVQHICTFLLRNDALWDMRLGHRGFAQQVYCLILSSVWCTNIYTRKIILLSKNERRLNYKISQWHYSIWYWSDTFI